MRAGHRQILTNAKAEVEYVLDFVEELVSTEDTRKLWRAWAGMLDHHVKAVSAMRRATDQGRSKAWSDALLHQQRSDPILQYAFQARDHATHVFESRREASPRAVSLGNLLSIGGSSHVTIEDCGVVDAAGVLHKFPDGTIEIRDGRYAGGTIPRAAVREQEHFLVVADVTNRSGTWRVPNPGTPPERRASEIAAHVARWLQDRLREAEDLSGQKMR